MEINGPFVYTGFKPALVNDKKYKYPAGNGWL
jgi:hypothetical protein